MLLPGACAPAPVDDREITSVLDAFYGAIRAGDADAAMRQIAPDAMFVESGRIETRDEDEANHLPSDIAFEKQVHGRRGPIQVTVDGNAAWVIASTSYDGVFDGNRVKFVSTQLAVLSRANDGWQIRSIHWSSR